MHHPPNNFDAYSPDMKAVYKARNNVTTQEEFDAMSHQTCTNCAPDQANMQPPHDHAHCPAAYMSGIDGARKFSPARVARAKQKISDNFDRLKQGQPATYKSFLAAALTHDELHGGHDWTNAAIALAEVSPMYVEDDTPIDEVLDAHDKMYPVMMAQSHLRELVDAVRA